MAAHTSIRTPSGIIIGKSGKTLFLSPGADSYLYGKKTNTITQAPDNTAQGDLAVWGDNNLRPYEMVDAIENSGVLNAVIETKARIAVGKGPTLVKIVGMSKDGQEEMEYVSDNEITDWMEMSNFFEDSFALAKDLLVYGNPFDQLILTKDRSKIAAFMRTDPSECRFSKMNNGRSEWVYMSSDWAQYNKLDDAAGNKHMNKIPLLDKTNPYGDLLERANGNRFMLSMQYPLYGRKYYAQPLWWSAREWVAMARGIPELKKSLVKNQMNILNTVEIHPRFWENHDPKWKAGSDEEKVKIQDEFYDTVEAALVGGENSYKSLFITTIPGMNGQPDVPGLIIKSLEDKMKEGKLLIDSAAANSEIIFANLMAPALLGADTPGGPYSGGAGSGSNIREGHLVQVITTELERRLIGKRFTLAKKFNKWDKDYALRYPNTLLTTLNTGANSKPTN